MSWKRWKLGVLVACLSGCFDGGLVAFIDPNINLKPLLFLIMFWICKDAAFFLKDHPVDKIIFSDTTVMTKQDVAGENTLKTTTSTVVTSTPNPVDPTTPKA